MAQRVLQQSATRLAARPASSILIPSRFIVPSTALIQRRPASISHKQATQVPQEDSLDILVNQRLQRPVAPHLGIYKWQITWIGSALNRITGIIPSGALYLFGMAYVAAPVFGWQLGSAALAAGFAKWPIAAKIAAKLTFALPFTYHSFNGLRHLMWDTGAGITNKQVIVTGWTCVGISVVSALGLAFLL